MVKLYNENEYTFQTRNISGKTYKNILCDENNRVISGYDHFIGQAEKRRNKTILHIEFPYTVGNYALFYEGTQKTLVSACQALDKLLYDNTLSEGKKAAFFRVLIESLHIVHHVSTKTRKSKLNGLNSLSTSCIDNCFCLDRIKNNDSVCSHCYSATQQKTQLGLQDRNTINGIILRNIVIPVKYWKKYINPIDITKFFRIESFGDVANKAQALNYINFMKAFPRVHFAAWTKNSGIWHFAMQEQGKPDNLSFVVSSNKVNAPELYHAVHFPEIDHVFTVYSKQYIENNNVQINCGGRSCMECIRKHRACYYQNTDTEIREELK